MQIYAKTALVVLLRAVFYEDLINYISKIPLLHAISTPSALVLGGLLGFKVNTSFSVASGNSITVGVSNTLFVASTDGYVYVGVMRYDSLEKIADAGSPSRFSVALNQAEKSTIVITNTYSSTITVKVAALGG